MSKRNEIRQKEQLQLQLQAQFNKLDQTVLSWLSKPTESAKSAKLSSQSTLSPISSETPDQFANQIVVPSGKGINFEDYKSNETNDINSSAVTINDFLDVVSANKKSPNDRRHFNSKDSASDKINKVGDVKRRNGGSKSLQALSNKLRTDRREKSKENVRKAVPISRSRFGKKDTKADADSDSSSDDDDEILHRKSKSSKFSAKSSKNKRPF